MPELPEVETIVRGLNARLPGREIIGLRADWAGTLAGAEPSELSARLRGQRVRTVRRRGKYIIIELDGDEALVIHLRMTGRLFLANKSDQPDRFSRVVIDLEGSDELRFADMRKFGRIVLAPVDAVDELLPKLGPEPLSESYTAAQMKQELGGSTAPIKSVLLNQQRLAGLGNIYADEALFVAGIHPLRSATGLSVREWGRLFKGVRQVLESAIANRGTSFRDYRDSEDKSGENQNELKVYRRTGLPCLKCGMEIRRIVVAGRSTHYCRRCQPETVEADTSCRGKGGGAAVRSLPR